MIIANQSELESLCQSLGQAEFITIDTEFMRERTYYPQLCLIQVSDPEGNAVAIDPQACDYDWTPLFDLLFERDVLKVFHAGRQDLEIFYNMAGKIVRPFFDTQIAAMVCGFGESVGYENLVRKITGQQVDKSVQFTDWSRRPLTNKQLGYALNDVIFLIDVYKKISETLEDTQRTAWLKQEEAVLLDPHTYEIPPENAWTKIKIRSDKPKVLSVLRELAAWREQEARERDVPRAWIMRDETLADIAVHMPQSVGELAHARGMQDEMAHGKVGKKLLAAVKRGMEIPGDQRPEPRKKKPPLPPELTPVVEMLRMLLKINCAGNEVAPKLVASQDDLEALAQNDEADIPALRGWRYELFGREALDLKHGKVGLALQNGKITKIKT